MPKIVREGLARSRATGVHPDADLLTAFVEHALQPAERTVVTEHLAVCGECREVVSLSLPAVPERQVSTAAASSRAKLWDGLFRWGAVAASLAIVAGLLIEHHWQTEIPPATTAQKSSQIAASDNLQPSSSPAVSAPSAMAGLQAEAKDQRADSVARNEVRRSGGDKGAIARAITGALPAPPPPPPMPLSAARDSYINSSVFSATTNAPEPAPVADLRQTGVPISVAGGAPSAQLMGANTAGPFHAPSFTATGTIDPQMALLGTPDVVFEPGTQSRQPAASRLGFPVRTIGSITRHLHLSLGAGSDTALAVNGLSFSPAVGQGFVAGGREFKSTEWSLGARAFSSKARGLADARQWKVETGKLMRSSGTNQWEEATPPGEPAHFTVVESRAAEVWVGGTHASVFHSSDSGANWDKLSLGVGASGDVTSISLDGPEVDVTTSENQTWTSSDGGHTWKMVAARQPTH